MKKFLFLIFGFFILAACSVIKTYDEIDYKKLNSMFKNKDSFILFINSDMCDECYKYGVTLNRAIDKYNVEVKAINLSLLSKKERSSLASVVSISAAPSLVFVEKGEEKDRISGDAKYSKTVEKFKEYNYIKE